MNTSTETTITRELIEDAMDYEAYSGLTNTLLEEGKTTNGDNRDVMLEYTKMNLHRSSRWDRRAKISEELQEKLAGFSRPITWLVITEGWCGDAAQLLPFINKMAEASPNITLKMILRDEYPEVMDEFLTNGSRSIPKLIALDDESLDVIGTWGPRPAIAHEKYMDERANPDIENAKAAENLHLWYAKDKGKTLQAEFMELLEEWE
ncbi:thioredoxin family protein [Gracilimonas mengyeensis]|uniref:Thioredoxin n=1 Tax=Gracilimonas mengyeensis TaxID=1302730 RepID=A0A521C368_9BACT|nr:thioredoxin family protein [Gracilimonas mengyeensis]SMO53251.1 Thioredoxin [Gracilimonas mengyeensis]